MLTLTDEVMSAAAFACAVINTPNCSMSPNCVALNRHPCSQLSGTCGPCMDGFIGDQGHKNSRCLDRQSIKTVRRLAARNRPLVASVTCGSDNDCAAEQWEVCVEGECIVQPKGCPNGCSGHGRCVFTSPIDENMTLTASQCTMASTCRPKCVCADGYKGTTCAHLASEFTSLLSFRHSVVQEAYHLSLVGDATKENVKSALNLLATIASYYDDLRGDTQELLTELAVHYMTHAVRLGFTSEELAVFNDVADLVAGARASQAYGNFLKIYGSALVADMSVGQRAFEVVGSTFRLKSLHMYADSGDIIAVSSSTTDLEDIVGVPKNKFLMTNTSVAGSTYRLVMTDTMANSSTPGGSELSSPWGLDFYDNPCIDEANCRIEVVLQFDSPLPTMNANRSYTTAEFACEKSVPSNHSFVCPDGDLLEVFCNGSDSGVVTATCPLRSPAALCKTIGTPLEDSEQCSVIAYTTYNVTCGCWLSTPSSRRRALQNADNSTNNDDDDSAVSMDLVAAGTTIIREFVNTWTSADDLTATDVQQGWQVLVTVASIGVVGVLMMLIGWIADDKLSKSSASKSIASSKNSVSPFVSKDLSTSGKPQLSRRTKTFRKKPQANLLDSALPVVLQPLPLWKKFFNEARVYHRWAGVVLHTWPRFSRPLRLLSLLMNILVMIFLEALTYDLSDPDDGSCDKQHTISNCYKEKSSLARGESMCYWDDRNGTCHFREISGDLYRIVVVAIVAAVVGTPFALGLEALISNILAAETINPADGMRRVLPKAAEVDPSVSSAIRLGRLGSGGGAQAGAATVAARKLEGNPRNTWIMLRKAEEALLSSVEDDYVQMQSELNPYRESLSPAERREFDRK